MSDERRFGSLHRVQRVRFGQFHHGLVPGLAGRRHLLSAPLRDSLLCSALRALFHVIVVYARDRKDPCTQTPLFESIDLVRMA